jgi:hypothetical protein
VPFIRKNPAPGFHPGFEELGVELITPGLYRVFFRDTQIGNSIPKRFVSELREAWSEPVDECIGD